MAKKQKRLVTKAEIRKELEKAIAEKGIEPLHKVLVPALSQMVGGTKALDDGTFTYLFTDGFEVLSKNFITVGIELVLKHTPRGKKKKKIQSDYDFWMANTKHVMKVHGIKA